MIEVKWVVTYKKARKKVREALTIERRFERKGGMLNCKKRQRVDIRNKKGENKRFSLRVLPQREMI